ncbi:MAG: hypothetical protein Q9208_002727 [Pyrenodesmia sp. 3 TL-2023]
MNANTQSIENLGQRTSRNSHDAVEDRQRHRAHGQRIDAFEGALARQTSERQPWDMRSTALESIVQTLHDEWGLGKEAIDSLLASQQDFCLTLPGLFARLENFQPAPMDVDEADPSVRTRPDRTRQPASGGTDGTCRGLQGINTTLVDIAAAQNRSAFDVREMRDLAATLAQAHPELSRQILDTVKGAVEAIRGTVLSPETAGVARPVHYPSK